MVGIESKLLYQLRTISLKIKSLNRKIYFRTNVIQQLPQWCHFLWTRTKNGNCEFYSSCYFYGEDHQSDQCEESNFIWNIEQEEHEVHKIDYNSQLKNILNELLRINQTSFDKFEIHCENLEGKVVNFENKLVEMKLNTMHLC